MSQAIEKVKNYYCGVKEKLKHYMLKTLGSSVGRLLQFKDRIDLHPFETKMKKKILITTINGCNYPKDITVFSVYNREFKNHYALQIACKEASKFITDHKKK